MTRTRQISAIDSHMRDKAMQAPGFRSRPSGNTYSPNRPMGGQTFPTNLLYRLRSGTTSNTIMSSCGSMREFCNNIQNITSDISTLLASVENFLPIISAYLSLIPLKETIPIMSDPSSTESYNQRTSPAPVPVPSLSTSPAPKQPPMKEQPSPVPAPLKETTQAIAQPSPTVPQLRPEDIQQLLNNPLVKNLISTFIPQNPR